MFTKPNPPGYALGDKISSAQMNQFNDDHEKTLDKTGDTIIGTVHVGTGAAMVVDAGGSCTINGSLTNGGATDTIAIRLHGAASSVVADSGSVVGSTHAGKLQAGSLLSVEDWIGITAASSWGTATSAGGGGNVVSALTYGPTRAAWYRGVTPFVLGAPQTPVVSVSYDGGATWSALAGIASHATTAGHIDLIEFNGDLYASIAGGAGLGTAAKIQKFTYAAGTWGSDLAWGATAGVTQSRFFTLGSSVCVVGFDTLAGGAPLLSAQSPDGLMWTGIATPGAPTSFSEVRVASSGSLAVIVPKGGATNTYYTTTNAGVALTARTGGWASSSTVSGIAYSAREGLWIIPVRTVGNVRQFWGSTDGISWTLRGTLSVPASIPSLADIATTEHVWAICGSRAGGGDSVAISVDSCVTWRLVPYVSPAAGGLSAGATYLPQIVAGPQQWGIRQEGGTAFTAARGYDGPALT